MSASMMGTSVPANSLMDDSCMLESSIFACSIRRSEIDTDYLAHVAVFLKVTNLTEEIAMKRRHRTRSGISLHSCERWLFGPVNQCPTPAGPCSQNSLSSTC